MMEWEIRRIKIKCKGTKEEPGEELTRLSILK